MVTVVLVDYGLTVTLFSLLSSLVHFGRSAESFLIRFDEELRRRTSFVGRGDYIGRRVASRHGASRTIAAAASVS